MSTQPMPEPIPVSTGRFNPDQAQPAPAKRPRCRALTTDGRRCKNLTVGALHLCYSHYRHRRPALPEPEHVSVPLLEDRSAIQLMLTQILHGILSRRLDPQEARAALYALHIAALTVPRPPRASSDDAPEPAVHHLGHDHQGFISADGDLADPPLNPSCAMAETDEAAAAMMDEAEPPNRVDPEDAAPDPPEPHPSHDPETCHCYTCSDYRDYIAQLTRKIQSSNTPRRRRQRA